MIDLSQLLVSARKGEDFAREAIGAAETYLQLGVAAVAVLAAWLVSKRLMEAIHVAHAAGDAVLGDILARVNPVAFPVLASLALLIAEAVSDVLFGNDWLLRGALLVAVLALFDRTITLTVSNRALGRMLRWGGAPLLTLYLFGFLDPLSAALDGLSLEIGNLKITLSGLLRVAVFGSLLFWLGWLSNTAGQNVIRRQERLDVRTREVMAKLFQIGLFVLVSLLLLQIMGINLTALAVFGGALGVGLGFGLQSIASNFISGIIILFDRSLTVGDYVEMDDGMSGYVRELNMRHTTLETFDGKDVLVPNERFITTPFTNWTHKNHKQRYRVDFSVAYHTDVRTLCELIRATVAQHPQVISGEHIPIEERPDCEIDSFGDSGINMFVEFWMDGIDDGRNRVGGDLLLEILETLQRNGIEIPFPQREVRLLNTSPGSGE